MTITHLSSSSYLTENLSSYEVNKRIDNRQNLLREYLNVYGGAGACAAIIENGTVDLFSACKISLNSNEMPSGKTIFELGSITKVFTTLVLMTLVHQGKVKLNDPIEIYLPNISIPELAGKKITLLHLATHYSGLPEMPDNIKENSYNPYKIYSQNDLEEFLSHCHLLSVPGEQFSYSDIGMGLLGYILSLIENKSYEQLLSEYILKPLNMESSGISLDHEQKKQFATGNNLGKEVEPFEMAEIFQGAGALCSNVQDMTTFLAANMDLFDHPLTELLKECHQIRGSSFPTMRVGLGWLIAPSSKRGDIFWHSGKTGGFRCFLGFNLKMQKGVLLFANSTEDWPRVLGLHFLEQSE